MYAPLIPISLRPAYSIVSALHHKTYRYAAASNERVVQFAPPPTPPPALVSPRWCLFWTELILHAAHELTGPYKIRYDSRVPRPPARFVPALENFVPTSNRLYCRLNHETS